MDLWVIHATNDWIELTKIFDIITGYKYVDNELLCNSNLSMALWFESSTQLIYIICIYTQ